MTNEILRQKIGDCKFAEKCVCKTKEAFEIVSLPAFCIYDNDSENPSQIVLPSDAFQLIVKNPKKNKVTFVKIDKCLLPDIKDQRRCDCLLFDANNFFFVEIKSITNKSRRSHARNDALLQLESTISYFISKSIEISNLHVKAIICFKNLNTYPIKASQKSQQAIFKAKYNVSLEEGNLIEF